MMACVGIALGEPVELEAGEVVNGLANDRTNVFLQQLARAAADPRTDSKEAVRRALAGERPDPARPARRDCSAGANCKVPNAGILAPPAWVRADEPAPRAAFLVASRAPVAVWRRCLSGPVLRCPRCPRCAATLSQRAAALAALSGSVRRVA